MGRAAGLGELFDDILKSKLIMRLGCVVGQEPRSHSLHVAPGMARCCSLCCLPRRWRGARGAEPDGIHEEDSDGPRLQRAFRRRRSVQIAGGRVEGLAAARSLQVERSCALAQRYTWNALSAWHDRFLVCEHLSSMAPTASEPWRRPSPRAFVAAYLRAERNTPPRELAALSCESAKYVWDLCRG